LQNKARRAICGAHYGDTTSPIYAKIKILKIVDLQKYEIAIFVRNWNLSKTPVSFNDYFLRINQVFKQTTRQSSNRNNLYIHQMVLVDFKNAFQSIRELNCGNPFLLSSGIYHSTLCHYKEYLL